MPTTSRRSLAASAPVGWAAGLALGLLVVGPVLRPGSLLNLDLVITEQIPVPPGFWGLGPELPRRMPYFVPLAWASTLIDGTVVTAVLMAGCIAVAFRGVQRLCAPSDPVAAAAGGLLYAAGPFVATRLATGHLGTALAAALLPWALPPLLRPGADLRRTVLWSAALGFAGINGGIFALACVTTGLIADRGRRAPAVLASWTLGQLPWLVPGIVVWAQGVNPSGSNAFGTHLDGPLGLLRLATGQGFWLPAFEVGHRNPAVPVVGGLVLMLAVSGAGALPSAWGRRAAAVAAASAAVVVASAVPGIDDLYADLAATTLGAPLREGHRVLALTLVWLIPAAAAGASKGSRRDLAGAALLGGSAAVAVSAFWGFGGLVRTTTLPPEWAAARAAVSADPGTVLALPWSQYVLPDVNGNRLVHHPSPFHLGGDVLLPSGRGEETVADELADPRLPAAHRAVRRLLDEGEVAGLVRLGVRWVVVVHSPVLDPSEVDGEGLAEVVSGDTLTLLAVKDAPSAALDGAGRPVDLDPLVAPLAWVDGEQRVIVHRPGADGWMRGWSPGGTSDEGLVELPSGTGPVWYWPSVIVLFAHLVTVSGVVVAIYCIHLARPVVGSGSTSAV